MENQENLRVSDIFGIDPARCNFLKDYCVRAVISDLEFNKKTSKITIINICMVASEEINEQPFLAYTAGVIYSELSYNYHGFLAFGL